MSTSLGDRWLRDGRVWTVVDALSMDLGLGHVSRVLVLRSGSALRVATDVGLGSKDWTRLT